MLSLLYGYNLGVNYKLKVLVSVMKLFDKLVNWCFEEKQVPKKEEEKFYIPCKNFFKLYETKEEVKQVKVVK